MPSTRRILEDFPRDAVALVRSSEKVDPRAGEGAGVASVPRNWVEQTRLDTGERRDG